MLLEETLGQWIWPVQIVGECEIERDREEGEVGERVRETLAKDCPYAHSLGDGHASNAVVSPNGRAQIPHQYDLVATPDQALLVQETPEIFETKFHLYHRGTGICESSSIHVW